MFPDRLKMFTLILISLLVGVLLMINLDRTIHATEGFDTSEHGWPLIYLRRTPVEFNMDGTKIEPYAWPWPPVPSENRVFSWMNLSTNLIVVGSISMVSYIMLRTIFERLGRKGRTVEGN